MKTTTKSTYGLAVIDNQTVFQKICNYDIQKEVQGYNLISSIYKCPKLLSYDDTARELIFEYCESFDSKILHNQIYHQPNTDFSQVLQTLLNPVKDLQLSKKETLQNELFFSGRANKIKKYFMLENINKKISFNGIKLPSLSKVIKKFVTIAQKNNPMYACVLQGDPTDLNCTTDGFITDYEVAGNNSITGEIAIFCGCYIVNSYYFYIKYVKSAHADYTHTLEKYKNHIHPEVKLEKKIHVMASHLVPDNNKLFVTQYLTEISKKLTKKQKKHIEKHLGLYLAMRMMTPVNLEVVEEKERYLLFALASYFFSKVKTIEDIIHLVNTL